MAVGMCLDRTGRARPYKGERIARPDRIIAYEFAAAADRPRSWGHATSPPSRAFLGPDLHIVTVGTGHAAPRGKSAAIDNPTLVLVARGHSPERGRYLGSHRGESHDEADAGLGLSVDDFRVDLGRLSPGIDPGDPDLHVAERWQRA